MKMYNEINYLIKDYVYDQYTKIVEDFKDYEKITRVKMLDAIYKVYSDYNNIISLCTTKELKYLEKLIKNQDNSKDQEEKNNTKIKKEPSKYAWEEKSLKNKFLIMYDKNHRNLVIPEEITETVKKAIKNVDWPEKKKADVT